MTEILFLFSSIAAGCVRVFVYLSLVFLLLSGKKPGRNCLVTAWMGIAVIFVLTYAAGWPGFCSMVLETAWMVVCAVRFQGADGRMSMFAGIFYEIAVSFWQFLIAAWSGVLFHSPSFLDGHTRDGQIAFWLFHVLLFAVAWYIWRHPDMEGKETFRFASAIVLAGFIAVITLSQQTALTLADDTLDMWMILAVILLMSVLVFHMNRQYEAEKELARLKSEQAALLEHDYTALNQAYAVNARLFHDFHNHIGALRQLLFHKNLEEAMQYLEVLQAPVKEMADTLWTGDETVDYLINSKVQTAKAGDIQYQVQVEFPRHTNLQSADLCAILGNLLDNAFEAVRQVREKRFVQLTIRRINQMLVIKVENNFYVLPVEKDGALQTTKQEHGLHGWGLKSARAAAEKYDGTVQTSDTGGVFRAVATLSFQSASTK